MAPVYFLDQLPRSQLLDHPPTHILDIPIAATAIEELDTRYLLMQGLMYGREASWTLPNVNYPPINGQLPTARTVEAVLETFDKNGKRERGMATDVRNLAHRLGLDDPRLNYLGPLTVLKPSIRDPERSPLAIMASLRYASANTGMRSR